MQVHLSLIMQVHQSRVKAVASLPSVSMSLHRIYLSALDHSPALAMAMSARHSLDKRHAQILVLAVRTLVERHKSEHGHAVEVTSLASLTQAVSPPESLHATRVIRVATMVETLLQPTTPATVDLLAMTIPHLSLLVQYRAMAIHPATVAVMSLSWVGSAGPVVIPE